ncbi:MAG: hypothetical protein SW833_00370 [Cyanobacteriota bacterium]|nr:hypothetical protein [Cyanobacteriota bacterium]
MAIITRIGATVYVRQGDIAPELSVEGASWNAEQQQVQLLVKNTGQASARPGINWTLRRGETVVATGTVDPQGIVAQSDRYFSLDDFQPSQPNFGSGEYQLEGELVWGGYEEPKTMPFSTKLAIDMPSQSVQN